MAAECLKPEILLKVTSLAEIFMENVSTDLSLGNLLAFAQLAMGMDAEKDIQFITMPNQDARYPRVSMVLPVVDELLAALNSGFDPYVDQIRASDLQVLVRNSDGSYSVTGGTLLDETLSRPRGSGSSSGGGQTAETPEEPEEELPDPDGSQELPPDGSQVIPRTAPGPCRRTALRNCHRMGPREIRRSRPLRAVETVACRRPAALRTPGAARQESSRSLPRRAALPPAGQRAAKG